MTAARRRSRTAPIWDAPITVGLLAVGVINTIQTVAQARHLPDALGAFYAMRGIGEYTRRGLASGIGWAVVVTSIASLVIAIGFAVPRIRDHRLAFWIPLAAAAVSGTVTVVLIAVAILADPAYLAWVRHAGANP